MLKRIVLIGALCLIAFLGLARLFGAAYNGFMQDYKSIRHERAYHNGDAYDKYTKAMEETLKQAQICEKTSFIFSGLFIADAMITFVSAVLLILQVF